MGPRSFKWKSTHTQLSWARHKLFFIGRSRLSQASSSQVCLDLVKLRESELVESRQVG